MGLKQLVILTASVILCANAQDWTYDGARGPANWGGFCKGKSQSPINIPRVNNTIVRYEPFDFDDYDRTPDKGQLTNTGSTIKYSSTVKGDNDMPSVSGGGLPGEYEFSQIHWHWGSVNSQGSEHTLNQVSYPVELHLVHFKKEYGKDLISAIGGGKGAYDTLAVLGVMLKLQNKPNPNLDPILNAIKGINKPQSKNYVKLFPLQDLLPMDTTQFYRYNGSLTTPGCNEIVVWTVFKDAVNISQKQLNLLRNLYTTSPVMRDNFRPLQPLNGRTIFEVATESSAMPTLKFNSVLILVSVLIGTNLHKIL